MKAIHTLLGLALLGAVPVISTGCFEAEEGEADDLDIAELEVDPVYTVTRVDLDPSGNHKVTTGTITLSEQLAQHAAESAEVDSGDGVGHAQQAIFRTLICGSSTLRIYSLTGYTGDEICFTGTGTADLRDYCRIMVGSLCTDRWDGEIESFKTGDNTLRVYQDGDDEYLGLCCGSCSQRAASTDVTDATSCEDASNSRYVFRGGCGPC
jgi:hypothetical protein